MRLRRRSPGPRAAVAAASGLCLFLLAGCGTSARSLRVEADRQVSARAGAALQQAGLTSQVEARSYHGVLALLGEVAREEEKARAETSVRPLEGVVRVNNLILVVGSVAAAGGSSSSKRPPLIARAGPAPAP